MAFIQSGTSQQPHVQEGTDWEERRPGGELKVQACFGSPSNVALGYSMAQEYEVILLEITCAFCASPGLTALKKGEIEPVNLKTNNRKVQRTTPRSVHVTLGD